MPASRHIDLRGGRCRRAKSRARLVLQEKDVRKRKRRENNGRGRVWFRAPYGEPILRREKRRERTVSPTYGRFVDFLFRGFYLFIFFFVIRPERPIRGRHTSRHFNCYSLSLSFSVSLIQTDENKLCLQG